MSYDPSLPTDKDKVRLYVGDTDPDLEFLLDEEIEFFITEEGSVKDAAAAAALGIAAKFAADTDYRFSTLWQDAGQAYDHFTGLAERLKSEAGEDLGIPTFEIALAADGTEGDPQFSVGMHDNR